MDNRAGELVRNTRRGTTLIELMIAIAILGITCVTLGGAMHTYQQAANRAYRIEGLARVLAVEMERFRACTDVRCVRALETLSPEAETWVGARVQRAIKVGPTTGVRSRNCSRSSGPSNAFR